MILPEKPRERDEHLKWVLDTCLSSQKERKNMYDRRRQFFSGGIVVRSWTTTTPVPGTYPLVIDSAPAGGRTAAGTATVVGPSPFHVSTFVITDPGAGYTTAPNVKYTSGQMQFAPSFAGTPYTIDNSGKVRIRARSGGPR